MFTAGVIRIGNQENYVVWKDIKSTECYWSISKYHKDDRFNAQMGEEVHNPTIDTTLAIPVYYNENYVVGVLKKTKISGDVLIWGQTNVIDTFIDTISFVKSYKFNKNDVYRELKTVAAAEVFIDFSAKDENLLLEYNKIDQFYTRLHVQYKDIEITLEEVPFKLKENAFSLVEADKLYKKRVLSKTIKDIDYAALCDVLDMSWYKEGDVYKKDYRAIKSLEGFELQIMAPLVTAIKAAEQAGTVLDVAVDTETTGLNVYNLDKNNPDKDHCVAIPISWIPNTAFVIFTDMEFHTNVDNAYATKRLAEIFENFKGTREIEIWDESEPVEKVASVQKMDLFGNVIDTKEPDTHARKKKKITISRTSVNLIGHNVMFDKRVFIDEDCYFYFNNDTMQMSFNIASKMVKGSNKLKMLTRKIFGHETPELPDVLGKGNEDKYRFIKDEEVARIYGGADADYTLQLFPVLRRLMSDELYSHYQSLDVPMLNILPRSEYYGLLVDEQKAFALGDTVIADIEVLKNFAYRYVGMFVDVYKQRSIIEAKKTAGYYATDEEYRAAIANIEINSEAIFEFEFKPTELRTILFDILKYPIKAWTSGKNPQPKLDKYAMKKLSECKRDTKNSDFNRLEKDIISTGITRDEYEALKVSNPKKASSMCLVSADSFNKCKYPLSLLLQKYAELNKEYTAYYKPMRETNMESKIFKSYSLARIETRRIQNAAQTMKGNLKALVQAYSDDYYLLDFDMSQVEYRIMLSLSHHMLMIDRMKDPERDYHTETASLINAIPAHKVDKKTRKKAKSVSFGVPYGLGERSLCDKVFGEVNDETLFSTRLLLAKWEKANKPVMDFLNSERDNALLAREMSKELRDFMDAYVKDEDGNYVLDNYGCKIDKPVGFIYDKYGFYRTFDLSDVGQDAEAKKRRATGRYNGAESSIRRAAGNFPIQCFAAELFRIILIRFYNRCEAEGINDKLIWHMLIHDELLCSVHKSIHPFFIYKLVKESCMVTMKGHTKYFVGINIGNTWGEVKDDAREAPVFFVDRIVKRWDAGEFGQGPFWFDDPWSELIKDERAKYCSERINEIIHKIQPNIDNEPINVPHIMEKFDNYTVRAYVGDFPLNGDIPKDAPADEKDDMIWASKFETWALSWFPAGKPIIRYDGELSVLHEASKAEKEPEMLVDDLDLSLLFDDDATQESSEYWSFDINECNVTYDSDVIDESMEEDVFSYEIEENNTATSIAGMLKLHTKYAHMNVMHEQVLITIPKRFEGAVKEYLAQYVSKTGKTAVFSYSDGSAERWLKLSDQTTWEDVDSYIGDLCKFEQIQKENEVYQPKHFKTLNKHIVIEMRSQYKFGNLEAWLMHFKADDGYAVLLKTPLGVIRNVPFKVNVQFEKIDSYLEKEV